MYRELQRTDWESETTSDLPLPSEPTFHWAGSPEKIELMRQRVEEGYHLFHPYDSRNVMVRQRESDANEFITAERQRPSVRLVRLAS